MTVYELLKDLERRKVEYEIQHLASATVQLRQSNKRRVGDVQFAADDEKIDDLMKMHCGAKPKWDSYVIWIPHAEAEKAIARFKAKEKAKGE